MSFVYANPASGPSAGGIGWVNFGNLNLKPGDSVTGVTSTLKDGTTIIFDIKSDSMSQCNFTAVQPPTYSGAAFGTFGYTGILGNVALYTNDVSTPTTSILEITNIVVKDSNGNAVTNYTAIAADAEQTGTSESWTFVTNGGGWSNLIALGGTPPAISGLGSSTAIMTGTLTSSGAYVLTTQSPTSLTLTTDSPLGGGQEAVALGFAVTKLSIYKNVSNRLDSNDQFLLDIQGTPSTQATTTGSVTGIQSEVANLFGLAGNTYTINEEMATGSVSPLSAYNQVISAANLSINGTNPPIGTLPINISLQLGDVINYIVLNSIPETFAKSVDKEYADLGDILTYTITVNNPNDFTINNILVKDPLPFGTSFVDIVSVSEPYIGNNLITGLTITSIGPNSTATIIWRAKVTSSLPIITPIINFANISIPNGISETTNTVSTNISHADLVSSGNFLKSATPNINVGDDINYTLNITNTGNAVANNVVIKDSIPTGTTYVPGSISSNIMFTGTPLTSIMLTAPISSGQTVTINFTVKAGNSIPNVNPIPNQAIISYNYTVDPAIPNGISVNGYSNIAYTQVSNATLVTKKSVDKIVSYVGDIITYNISITNTGNVPANNVVIADPIPNDTSYISGSLTVNRPYTGSLLSTISLATPIAPGETVSISFQVKVATIPNPNPISNKVNVSYAYTVDLANPNGVSSTSVSNIVTTKIFKYNFNQQITDLIESIALEEAALAAISNAEGAKIQAMVANKTITPEELLCLNKSVQTMIESITILESILNQKLSVVSCQIEPTCI